MAKVEEKKKTPPAPVKPKKLPEKERLEALKGEPFVVASYHVEVRPIGGGGGKEPMELLRFFVLLDIYGRRMELQAAPHLRA